MVNQPQIELGVTNLEGLEWGEVRRIGAVARYGHVVIIDRAGHRLVGGVRHADYQAQIGGFHEMLVPEVAVAEVAAHEGLLRHVRRQSCERPEIALERVPGRLPGCSQLVLQGYGQDLDTDVPLQDEVLCRDSCDDLGDFAPHRFLIGGPHQLKIAGTAQKHPCSTLGQRQRDLEFDAWRNHPGRPQGTEVLVRFLRLVSVAQVVELHGANPVLDLEEPPFFAILCEKPPLLTAKWFGSLDGLQRRMPVINRGGEELNPQAAVARLAIG